MVAFEIKFHSLISLNMNRYIHNTHIYTYLFRASIYYLFISGLEHLLAAFRLSDSVVRMHKRHSMETKTRRAVKVYASWKPKKYFSYL